MVHMSGGNIPKTGEVSRDTRTAGRLRDMRKVALITGGAVRVGRAVGLMLAGRGYDLLVTYKSSGEAAKLLVNECGKLGAGCEVLQADLSDTQSAERVAAWQATNFGGRLDLLVHNASMFPEASLGETTAELMNEVMRVHVTTPMLLTGRLAGALQFSRGSVIAMTDGVEGKGYLRYPAYAASKAALSSLVHSWARALAPLARANGIAPGAVLWPDTMSETEKAKYLVRVPLGRVGTAEDVAKAVWYLAEEATYVTGTILKLDGGRSTTGA